jgi:uncharacterized membrane protein
MSQHEINHQEWANPENWSDSLIGFYFSKRDSRTFVPKRNPSMGWTLNLAHSKGAWWMLALMIGPLLIMTTILALSARG